MRLSVYFLDFHKWLTKLSIASSAKLEVFLINHCLDSSIQTPTSLAWSELVHHRDKTLFNANFSIHMTQIQTKSLERQMLVFISRHICSTIGKLKIYNMSPVLHACSGLFRTHLWVQPKISLASTWWAGTA